VRWDAPPLGEGMEALIEEWLDEHPEAALVIVDTLGRVRTPGDGKRNAYQVDVQDVGRLQSLTRDRAVALILVHHTKKGKEDDFVSQVSGTLGIAGSADTVLVINRKRLIELATIEVTSRELPEASLGVRFAGSRWIDAPEALAGVSVERLSVYDTIKLHGPIQPVGVARLLRSERTSVQHLCSALLDDGLIVRTAGGYVTAEAAGVNADDAQVH
jgi:molybdenum cofactor biosynthesis enzyme